MNGDSITDYRGLLANLPGMVYKCRNDENWTMLFVSEAVEQVTGYRAEDLLNNQVIAFIDIVFPDDVEFVNEKVRMGIEKDGHFNLEYRIRRSDGEIRWVWEQGHTVFNGQGDGCVLEGYITDVTKRKSAELKLAQMQRQSAVILQSVAEGIHGIDREGRLMFVNAAAANMLGYTSAEMLGKQSHALVHHHRKDGALYPIAECPVFKTLRDGRIRRIDEDYFFRKDGSAFSVEYVVSPMLDTEGEVTGAVVSFSDITHRRELEEQLLQAQRMDALGQLTGGIAHDFNNLLTVILGNAELLEESLLDDGPKRTLANMVVKAAQRGAQLTQALLAFARKQPLEPKIVDINNLLEQNKPFLQRALGEQIDVALHCDNALYSLHIDPVQLESALLNLAINARDAMNGSGQLLIHTQNHWFSVKESEELKVSKGAYIEIAVSDSGAGIAPELIERVFEPFFTTKEKGKGTGLGLAMVYGFVRQSGGQVRMTSVVNKGTTVSLFLPALIGLGHARR
ncbi:MAG: PAS domain S-box protein [Pusillimonas sp.]|nr:PAS domain S-box protein [Pusillimonas sp.]